MSAAKRNAHVRAFNWSLIPTFKFSGVNAQAVAQDQQRIQDESPSWKFPQDPHKCEQIRDFVDHTANRLLKTAPSQLKSKRKIMKKVLQLMVTAALFLGEKIFGVITMDFRTFRQYMLDHVAFSTSTKLMLMLDAALCKTVPFEFVYDPTAVQSKYFVQDAVPPQFEYPPNFQLSLPTDSQPLQLVEPFQYSPNFQLNLPAESQLVEPFQYSPNFQLSLPTDSQPFQLVKPFQYPPNFQLSLPTDQFVKPFQLVEPFQYSPNLQLSLPAESQPFQFSTPHK